MVVSYLILYVYIYVVFIHASHNFVLVLKSRKSFRTVES